MSDTPRTDDLSAQKIVCMEWVPADFARELERELKSANLALDDWFKHTDRANKLLDGKHLGKNILQAALDEIEELRAALSGRTVSCERCNARAEEEP